MLPLEGVSGESLVVAGAAMAVQIAQGRSDTELLFLSAFFEVLGDNLALIATQRADTAVKQARPGAEAQGQKTAGPS